MNKKKEQAVKEMKEHINNICSNDDFRIFYSAERLAIELVNLGYFRQQPHKERLLTFNGKTMRLSDWARKYNIRPSVLTQRIDIWGWSVEKALLTPVNRHKAHKNGRRVCQYDLEGNLIKVYDKVVDAAKAVEVSIYSIIHTCKGSQKTCHGYVFKYEKED